MVEHTAPPQILTPVLESLVEPLWHSGKRACQQRASRQRPQQLQQQRRAHTWAHPVRWKNGSLALRFESQG